MLLALKKSLPVSQHASLTEVFENFLDLMISEYYPGQAEKTQNDHDAWCANRLRLYVQELSEFNSETLRKAFRSILVEKKSQSWPSVRDCITACRVVSSPTVTRFDGGNADFAEALAAEGLGCVEAQSYASKLRIVRRETHVEIDTSHARSLKVGQNEGGTDLSSWLASFLDEQYRGAIGGACQKVYGTSFFEITDGRSVYTNRLDAKRQEAA